MGPHGHNWGPAGKRGRMPEPPQAPAAEVTGWLAGRLPEDWFTDEPDITIDRDEITIIGTISLPESADDVDRAQMLEGRVTRFREETRPTRMRIAQETEAKFGRKVSWGVAADDRVAMFTTLAVPAMTRLRQPERQVLDTLVDSGVARSRAEALAWCVRLVGEHESDWIASLRSALDDLEKARTQGPS
ncbi:MAG: hypothetical protein QG597_671 [Actinomycetota bacterium]|nr:hypothetical protein [Actinomycetota bacterium]